MYFTASNSVTGVIPSSNCLCNLRPREEVTLLFSCKTSQISLASCSLWFMRTVSFPPQEIQRNSQCLWRCKAEYFLLQLMGIPLHDWLMALPPSHGKCSHCKSGAVRFHLKLFTVLPQLMFLLWLLLPYLSLFVPSSTIACVSSPYCGLCVSFLSVPFPKCTKKIPFSSISLSFCKSFFQVCFINNIDIRQSWKVACPCPACLIEPQGQGVYIYIFSELLSV